MEPAVRGGVVYSNTQQSHLFALDAKTGDVIWDFKREGKVYSKPALAGDMLYFGSGDHFLYALNPETGKEKWKFEAQDMVCNPVVHDGRVYFGSGPALYALE
jgi:outer membrane protein assembly factor BamB